MGDRSGTDSNILILTPTSVIQQANFGIHQISHSGGVPSESLLTIQDRYYIILMLRPEVPKNFLVELPSAKRVEMAADVVCRDDLCQHRVI